MTENLTPNAREHYTPSSSEKKQAVLMYMFVGLLLSMGKREVSRYTHHHIKQAMGWLILLVLVIFLDVILAIFGLVFGRFFLRLAFLITIPILAIGILCAKQARDGKYQRDANGTMKFFDFFAGLGSRVLNLFDANHYQTTAHSASESLDNAQQIPTNNEMPAPAIDLSQYEISETIGQTVPPQNFNPDQSSGLGQ